jgi:hypothetical protein
MKKHFLTLITALLLIAGGLLVCGCEKEPPPPPEVEPELQPTLELSVTPEGEIPYGDVATLEWKTTNAFRLFINDERQDNYKEGNKGTGKLFKDTTYTVKAQRVTLFAQKSVTIEVGDWTTSTFGLVSYYPWKYDSIGISSLDGKILERWGLDPEILSWVVNFYKDGRYTVSSHPTIVQYWSAPDNNTIVINGSTSKLQVNQKEMIISVQTTYNSELVWFDTIYKHASDTPTDPI